MGKANADALRVTTEALWAGAKVMEEVQRKCDNCEEREASFSCSKCKELYCSWCDATLHKSPAIRNHERSPLESQQAADDSMKARILGRLKQVHQQLGSKAIKRRVPLEERTISVSTALNFEHAADESAQCAPQDITVAYKVGSEPPSDWADVCASLTVPAGCQSMLCVDFEGSDQLDEASCGVIEGLVSQMLEAVLAEADYFISFETILLAAQESTPTLFRVSLYFSTNFYDKLVGENAWLGHLKAFNGTLGLQQQLTTLLEADDSFCLYDLLGQFSANLELALTAFHADSIASMPPMVKGIAEGIDAKLDQAVDLIPMTAARLSVELDLDALEVAQIAEQELQMATMAAVRELLLKVPKKMPADFSLMLQGVTSLRVCAEGQAYATARTSSLIPAFQLLPQDGPEGDESDDGEEW